MPLIESSYRIDEKNRSFQGTSFGGIVTTVLMLLALSQLTLFVIVVGMG